MKHSIPNNLSDFISQCERFSHYETMKDVPKEYDAMWILRDAHLSTLKLLIDIPYEEMYAEAVQAGNKHGWEYHRDSDGSGWAGLTIHGQGKHITNTPEFSNTDVEYHWTEVSDDCPVTKKWLDDSPYFYDYMRVRFMLVEPDGFVLPHRDFNGSKLGPINIALNNPEDCKFYMEDAGTVPWQPGDIRLMNVGRKHAVYNNSDTPRIHMILHSNRGEAFKQIVVKSFEKFRQDYNK